jgi:hypothetical protein
MENINLPFLARSRRRDSGMTQIDFSNKSKIPLSYITKFELGKDVDEKIKSSILEFLKIKTH